MLELKKQVAQAALEYVGEHRILGIGTGSTANCFIAALEKIKNRIDACVASSNETSKRLREAGFVVVDLNSVDELPLYIDGADEVNARKELIKGAGGALTREKIMASVAKQFLCLVEERKRVAVLGEHPIAIEVLPMARSFVGRELVRLQLNPVYRVGFVTDNGNCILDAYADQVPVNSELEDQLNLIPGVVENGIFVHRKADQVLVANSTGVFSV